jgi:hypothetical protein
MGTYVERMPDLDLDPNEYRRGAGTPAHPNPKREPIFAPGWLYFVIFVPLVIAFAIGARWVFNSLPLWVAIAGAIAFGLILLLLAALIDKREGR